MAYIFLDESGDLGFKKTSSKWFIFTIVLTNNHRRVEKIVKKVKESIRKKKRRGIHELHAYNAPAKVKLKMLQLLSQEDDLKVLCIILNKKKVHIDFKNQKNYLYNYTANVLLEKLHGKKIINIDEPINLYIDQKDTNKFIRNNFEKYLQDNFAKRGKNSVVIKIKPSHSERCLQAVDFVSWAIFRKYELGDYEYYEKIKNKIIEENILFA